MTPDIPALAQAPRGITANGVPFVALPPDDGREAQSVVVLWHGGDPPRTEEALAAAVPMRDLRGWRLYLGLPLYGKRMPAGGFEEIMRRGSEDAVSLLLHPIIDGAVAELTVSLDDLTARLSIADGLPLGIFGFSMGGTAALLAVSLHLLPFKAAATFGAVPDVPAFVDAAAPLFGITYEWTDQRRVLAEQISTAHRARALAASGAAILLGVGADDPYPAREPSELLAAAVQAEGGSAEARIVPNVGHGFVEEPGTLPAPQGPEARAVDRMATEWFRRHLSPPTL